MKSVILLLLICIVHIYAKSYNGYRVYSIRAENVEQIKLLQKWELEGLDFWGSINRAHKNVTVMVPPSTINKFKNALNRNQFKYSLLIKNVQTLLNKEARQQKSLPPRNDGRINFDRYERFDNINQYLNNLAKDYSNKVKVENIGKSYEGRDLNIIKISTGKDQNGNQKPAIYIDGGIHAREWIAPSTVLYFIHELVENNQLSNLIENVDWYILPCANPDGYEYTHTRDRFWRKTRSKQGFYYGVDPNRNFGYKWGGLGTSNDPSSDIYRGTEAFSEPETRAIRDFILAHKDHIKLYLTFHSYGEYILYPWGYDFVLPSDADALKSLGDRAAKAIESHGQSYYTVGNSAFELYPAAGGSDDWAKGVGSIQMSYTVELPGGGSGGFDPPPRQILPIATETFSGLKEFHKHVDTAAKKSNPTS